jgi:hypothetical protein
MEDQITVGDKTYQLPAPLTAAYFEATKNLAVLKPDAKSPSFEGRTIIDSVDLKGDRPEREKTAEAVKLLLRHGAKIVGETPLPSVA